MYAFNFIDIILFLGVSQGLFLSVSLRLIHNRNQSANKILSFLLLIAVLMLFGRISAYRIPENWVWRFGVLIDTTIFLFGPFIYTYVRRLMFNENPPFRLRLRHYLPAAFHLGYYFWTLSFPLDEFNGLYFSGKLNLLFFIVEAAGLASFIFYWIKTVLLIRQYRNEEGKQLSYHQSINNFLILLQLTLGVFMVLWLMSFLSINFLKKTLAYVNYVTMWISTPLFIYVIGYYTLRQPEIFRVPFEDRSKTEKHRLKPEEIQKLQKRLYYYISDEQIYRQSDLTLKKLADKLNTSPNNLSWLLNQIYQSSFYDYINSHRIEEFIARINQGEHQKHTLLAMAMDVGFNSKSTFNRVFKTLVGTTPREYLKNRNVA